MIKPEDFKMEIISYFIEPITIRGHSLHLIDGFSNLVGGPLFPFFLQVYQTRWGSPGDRRPSTAEAPPIGKIHPFSKMALTFEPLIGF